MGHQICQHPWLSLSSIIKFSGLILVLISYSLSFIRWEKLRWPSQWWIFKIFFVPYCCGCMPWKICHNFFFDSIPNDPLVIEYRWRTKFLEVDAFYETSELKICHFLLYFLCWLFYSLFGHLILDPLGPCFFLSRCCYISSLVDRN